MLRPTKVVLDFFSKQLIVTMHNTENNEVTEEYHDPHNLPVLLHQMDVEFPYPYFDTQFETPIGKPQWLFQKGTNPQ